MCSNTAILHLPARVSKARSCRKHHTNAKAPALLRPRVDGRWEFMAMLCKAQAAFGNPNQSKPFRYGVCTHEGTPVAPPSNSKAARAICITFKPKTASNLNIIQNNQPKPTRGFPSCRPSKNAWHNCLFQRQFHFKHSFSCRK